MSARSRKSLMVSPQNASNRPIASNVAMRRCPSWSARALGNGSGHQPVRLALIPCGFRNLFSLTKSLIPHDLVQLSIEKSPVRNPDEHWS